MRIHGLIWLLAFVLMLIGAPLVVKLDTYTSVLRSEIKEAERWYGEEELVRVESHAESLYQLLMVSTGIDGRLDNYIKTGEQPADNGKVLHLNKVLEERKRALAAMFVSYWACFIANIYLVCWRSAQYGIWLVYLLPFSIAIVIDGILVRKAKLASFRYTSPTAYNFSWHAMIGLCAAAMVSSTVVVTTPVLVYPAAIALLGLLMRLLIGNIQHSA